MSATRHSAPPGLLPALVSDSSEPKISADAPPRRGAFWHTENRFMFGFRLYSNMRHSRARHPLMRLLTLVAGAAVLLVVLAFGFFAAVALAIVGAVVVLLNALRTPQQRPTQSAPPQAPAGVIEGEFKILRETSVRH